jgi:hypothetical protein
VKLKFQKQNIAKIGSWGLLVFSYLLYYIMTMRSFISFSFCFLLVSAASAQRFVHPEFKRAVDVGTRTCEGIPGDRYFQNTSHYSIDVKVDPKKGTLKAMARIEYFNTSPDTLRKLVLRLYQNMRKEGGVRDNELSQANLHKGVNIKQCIINGADLVDSGPLFLQQQGSNLLVKLKEPLCPGASTGITIAWSYSLPGEALHRFGKYGEQDHFIAYWYPQLAVYDDIDGWDELNYTDTQEFYSELNSYEVNISVPKNCMVWATGKWLNPDAILSGEVLDRYRKAFTSDQRIEIITARERAGASWRKKSGDRVFCFKADSVSDFAFAISDTYLWDGASVLIDSATHKRVLVQAAYKPGASYFDQVVTIGCRSVGHFSSSSYGVPYPFSSLTVFNGQGGMEFPMMVNDGTFNSYDATAFVTMHELAHAYFPFFVYTNERKHAWMDEGLTTYLPMATEKALNSNYHPIERIIRSYEFGAGTDIDVPLYIPSSQTRGRAYLFYTYVRSVIALYMLEDYMGEESFRQAIQSFIYHWKYKHPLPEDLFNTLKKFSEKELDWLIDQWFYTPGWPDLALTNVSREEDSLSFTIQKNGAFSVPVEIQVKYKNAAEGRISFPLDIWDESDSISVHYKLTGEPEAVFLNYKIYPDKNRKDNIYHFSE